MRICVTSDWHFGIKKNSDLFLDNSLKTIKNEIVPYLKKNKITDIYFLGDLWDNRNTINVKVKNAVYDLFDTVLKDFNIIILIGNHDTYLKSSIELHSLKMFKKFSNIEVIEDITLKEVDGRKFLFVPWQTNYSEFKTRITEKNIYCDASFMHADINGCYMNKLSSIVKDGLDQDLIFNSYGKSFLGHFHLRSVNKRGENEIVYVGTPYELNRNDKNEPKGFCILDTKTMDYKFVDTENYIKFIDITYPEIPKESKITGNIVDILVVIDKDFSDKDYQKYLKLINSFNPLLVNPITKYAIFNSVDNTNKTFAVKSTIESVHEYINDVLDISETDKSTIFNKIEKLYSECKQI